MNIHTKFLPISPVVSEKRIKMFTDKEDDGHQVMEIPHMILWVRQAKTKCKQNLKILEVMIYDQQKNF